MRGTRAKAIRRQITAEIAAINADKPARDRFLDVLRGNPVAINRRYKQLKRELHRP